MIKKDRGDERESGRTVVVNGPNDTMEKRDGGRLDKRCKSV